VSTENGIEDVQKAAQANQVCNSPRDQLCPATHQTGLQQPIEGQMKDIEPDIDPEQGIGYSEGPAVTKT
jgi:hypothetical protein